jgi:hypothetical protein
VPGYVFQASSFLLSGLCSAPSWEAVSASVQAAKNTARAKLGAAKNILLYYLSVLGATGAVAWGGGLELTWRVKRRNAGLVGRAKHFGNRISLEPNTSGLLACFWSRKVGSTTPQGRNVLAMLSHAAVLPSG